MGAQRGSGHGNDIGLVGNVSRGAAYALGSLRVAGGTARGKLGEVEGREGVAAGKRA